MPLKGLHVRPIVQSHCEHALHPCQAPIPAASARLECPILYDTVAQFQNVH